MQTLKKLIVFSLPIIISYLLFALSAGAQEIPSVKIISSPDGNIFESGEEISVSIRVHDFTFVDFKSNREPFPGNDNTGHAHLWIVPTKTETGSLNHDDARKISGLTPVKAVVPQEKGEYKIVIELTQNHHAPYDPPARAEYYFSVGSVGSAGIASFLLSSFQFFPHAVLTAFSVLIIAGFFLRRNIAKQLVSLLRKTL